MVSMVATSAVDCGFESRSGQNKDCKIGICCFSAKHGAWRSRRKDWLQRTRHTTPPLPPLSNATRFLRNSPVFKSQIFTVPSSDEVITNFLLNCKQVTALECLFGPRKKKIPTLNNSKVSNFSALSRREHVCVCSGQSKRDRGNQTSRIRLWCGREKMSLLKIITKVGCSSRLIMLYVVVNSRKMDRSNESLM
jgi:hypothetical protein